VQKVNGSILSVVLATVHSCSKLDLLNVVEEIIYVSCSSKTLSSVNERLAPAFEPHPVVWMG